MTEFDMPLINSNNTVLVFPNGNYASYEILTMLLRHKVNVDAILDR